MAAAVAATAVASAAVVSTVAVPLLTALAAALTAVSCCSYRCCFTNSAFLSCLGSRAGVINNLSMLLNAYECFYLLFSMRFNVFQCV